MIFHKIIKFAICLTPLMFLFSGCTSLNGSTKPEEEISSLSISQNHMDRNYCYSFSAYKSDDSYYLNAWCLLTLKDNDYRDVNLEDVSITKEEFDEFTKLDEKYDFFSYLKEEKKTNKFQPLDETTAKFEVSYDGESINLETSGECFEAVYSYFIDLAEKYSE